jgi:hypothetical protein
MNINGDAASVTSQTIPYENTALTPTIHDKISAIQSGITLISITWTSSGNIVDFTLSGYTLDPTIVYWVTAGGQIQQLTHDYVIDTGNTNLHFNYFPEVGLPITITFQHT